MVLLVLYKAPKNLETPPACLGSKHDINFVRSRCNIEIFIKRAEMQKNGEKVPSGRFFLGTVPYDAVGLCTLCARSCICSSTCYVAGKLTCWKHVTSLMSLHSCLGTYIFELGQTEIWDGKTCTRPLSPASSIYACGPCLPPKKTKQGEYTCRPASYQRVVRNILVFRYILLVLLTK